MIFWAICAIVGFLIGETIKSTLIGLLIGFGVTTVMEFLAGMSE